MSAISHNLSQFPQFFCNFPQYFAIGFDPPPPPDRNGRLRVSGGLTQSAQETFDNRGIAVAARQHSVQNWFKCVVQNGVAD